MEHLQLDFACANLVQLENPEIGLFDLTIEHQVQLLEYLKKYKDIEHGKAKGKGFGNCWKLNSKRHPRVYTFLEEEFRTLAEDFNLQLNHEVRIRVKDRLNRQHIFKLDNWHKNYLLVARRDVLRKKLLKKVGIRSLTVPVVNKGKHGHIHVPIAKRVIKEVLKAKISSKSLDFFLNNQEFNRGDNT
jgi:hypothetical protein